MGRGEDMDTTTTPIASALDFGETYVDTSLPFGLLGLENLMVEVPPPPATSKRAPAPRHAPPAPAPAARSVAPAPPRRSSAPALPSRPRAPSVPTPPTPSVGSPHAGAVSSRPRAPSVPPPPSSVEVFVEAQRGETTRTARMAIAPASAPLATPLAFVAPLARGNAPPPRPRFVEAREPLPSVSCEVESLPPLFMARGPSPLEPAPSSLSLVPPKLVEGSASVPASILALGLDDGTFEPSVSFRPVRAQAAYGWAAVLLVVGIVFGAAFGRLTPTAAASAPDAMVVVPPPATPEKAAAPPPQPPIEELTPRAEEKAPAPKKLAPSAPIASGVAVAPAPPRLAVEPARPPPSTSRLAVLADTKKPKKGEPKAETDTQSAAAAETLERSKRAIGDSL